MFEDWPELSEEEEQRENAACIERFEQMLESGGNGYFDEDEYIFIIDHYMLQEDLGKAEAALKRSLEHFPDRLSLQLRRVGLLSARMQPDEALSLLQQIDRQYPKPDGICLYEEAVLYLELDALEEAEDKFKAIFRLPECERREVVRDPNFYNDLSDLYEGKGELFKAIEAKQQAVRKGVAKPEELGFLVAQLRENADYDESVRFFRKRVDENPLSEADWLCLGKTLMEGGQIAEAREALDNALALGKEDSEACVDQATLLAMEKQFTPCEEMLEHYFRRHASDLADKLRCYNQIARCVYEHQDPQTCLRFCQKSIDLQPEEAYAYALAALAYGETGKYETGLSALDTALRLEPDELHHWLLKSEYLIQLNREEEVEQTLRECCAHFPNEPKAWLAYSYYFVGIGDMEKAISLLTYAATIDSQPLYIYRLADYFFLKGDDVNGRFYLDLAYTADPGQLNEFLEYDEEILKIPAVQDFLNGIKNKKA